MPSQKDNISEFLLSKIRTIPDFPKPGIQFKDITTLLADKEALKLTSQELAKPYLNQNIDIVVGLEARGFLFGVHLAALLDSSFVPVRKPGKLPAEVISESYALEYGMDSLEMHADAIPKGSRVLIHDDLIATGGTAAAASRLVERLGGEVVGYSFIIELGFLKGREILPNIQIESIMVV